MKLDKQVCTLDQSKKLVELGVKQDANFYWKVNEIQTVITDFEMKRMIERSLPGINEYFPAYTEAELLKMLPFIIGCKNGLDDDYFLSIHGGRNGWHIQYKTNKGDVIVNSDGDIDRAVGYLHNTYRVAYDLADCAARYLIMLLESKTLPAEEVNKRIAA
jgi:hypothetical protein